jgi:heptaprenyl diphosphate synthase
MPDDRFTALVGPRPRFVWGLTLIVLFVLTEPVWARAAEVVLFSVLATAAGKRIRWGYFAILLVSITAFNLLSPWGAVLWEWGPLRITSGALVNGLRKGLTVVGLVFISLFSVSPDLRLPGRFGHFLGRSLLFYELLYSRRGRVKRATLVADIDRILEETMAAGSDRVVAPRPDVRTRWTAPGLTLVTSTTALAAAAALLPRL